MHLLGLWGMPRRIYTYQAGLGWDTANTIATVGGFLFGLGTLLTVINVFWSRRRGEIAGPIPWQADSLEWATASPTPEWNFTTIPARHRAATRCGTARLAEAEVDADHRRAPRVRPPGRPGPGDARHQRPRRRARGGAAHPRSPPTRRSWPAWALAAFFVGLLVWTGLVVVLGVVVAAGGRGPLDVAHRGGPGDAPTTVERRRRRLRRRPAPRDRHRGPAGQLPSASRGGG